MSCPTNQIGRLPLPTYSKGRGDKKRDNLLSLNVFRNLHFYQKNQVKQSYASKTKWWVESLPKYHTIVPQYTLYFANNRKKDIDNYTFPIHKFLMDSLVAEGIIEDDNYDYVPGFSARFGGVSDENYVIVELDGELVNESEHV